MYKNGFCEYWWRFATSPDFQEQQPWMKPVLRFFGLLPPNAWTTMRIPGGIIICWLMSNGLYISSLLSLLFFVLTDWADGKSARVRGQVTPNGGILDGFADKLLILPIIGCLVFQFMPQCYSYWHTIVPLLFLSMVTSELSRIFMPLSGRFDKRIHSHAILYGKYKFAVQIILAIALWFAVYVFPFWPWWPIWISFLFSAAIILSVFSLMFRLYPEFERFAADVITLGNLCCGLLAILFASAGKFRDSIALISIAGVLDMADGLVARKTKPAKQKTGPSFGDIADDVGDFVSFAAAPAFIIYLLSQNAGATAIYFVATTGRLIFFVVQGVRGKSVPGVFQGVPSPAAAMFLGSFLLWEHPIASWVLPLIGMGIAAMEVAFFLRWYHFRMIFKIPNRERIAAAVCAAILFFFVGSGEAFTAMSLLYFVFFFAPVANARWGWA